MTASKQSPPLPLFVLATTLGLFVALTVVALFDGLGLGSAVTLGAQSMIPAAAAAIPGRLIYEGIRSRIGRWIVAFLVAALVFTVVAHFTVAIPHGADLPFLEGGPLARKAIVSSLAGAAAGGVTGVFSVLIEDNKIGKPKTDNS